MQNLHCGKINGFLKCKGLKMKNIVLIFGAIIMAIAFNACGIAQDSHIDSSTSNAILSDSSANQKADSTPTNPTIYTKKYLPKNRAELVALINDTSVNLAEIDTSKITDMSFLFADVSAKKCKDKIPADEKDDGFYRLFDIEFGKLSKRHEQNCLNTAYKRLAQIEKQISSLEDSTLTNKSAEIKHLEDKIAEQQLCKNNFSAYIAPKIKQAIFDTEFDTWFDEHAPRGEGIRHTRTAYLTSAEKKEIANTIKAQHKSCQIITNDEIQKLEALKAEQKRYDDMLTQINALAEKLYSELGVIDSWNVSSVTDMSYMFYGFGEFGVLIDKGLESWDTSKVKSMRGLFATASYEREKFHSSKHWNLDNGKFMGTSYIQIKGSLGVDSWDTRSLEDLGEAFAITNFAPNINAWNVSKVQKMDKAFYHNNAFNQPLNKWDTRNVKTMKAMFANALDFNQPLNSWNVANVEDMSEMFMGAYGSNVVHSAFNQPLDKWDTSSVKNMERMFQYGGFNQPINSWNVSSVESMADMFNTSLFNQPLDLWDISKVRNFKGMFAYFDRTEYTQIKSLESWGDKVGKKVKGGIKAIDFGYPSRGIYEQGMLGEIRINEPSDIERYPKRLVNRYKKEFDGLLKEAIKLEQEDKCLQNYNAQSQIDKDFLQAVSNRDLSQVKALHKKGANLNVKDKNCDPALLNIFYGDSQGRYEIIEFLLKNGADINSVDNYGNTPLMNAVMARGRYIVYDSDEYKETLKIAKTLLKYGANVNLISQYGYTALMEASGSGHYDAVKLLVENGAKINALNNRKETALNVAINKLGNKYKTKGFYKIVAFLLENGADLTAKNRDDKNAIDLLKERAEELKNKHDTDFDSVRKMIAEAQK